jgi:hypothetical protein
MRIASLADRLVLLTGGAAAAPLAGEHRNMSDSDALGEIERLMLWLSVAIVHHAKRGLSRL